MPQYVIVYIGGDQPSSPEEGKKHFSKYMDWLSSWGIFRPDKKGKWELLNDETHQSFGISSVSQTDEYVQINYENPFKRHVAEGRKAFEKFIYPNPYARSWSNNE